jgi:hypothetical protein
MCAGRGVCAGQVGMRRVASALSDSATLGIHPPSVVVQLAHYWLVNQADLPHSRPFWGGLGVTTEHSMFSLTRKHQIRNVNKLAQTPLTGWTTRLSVAADFFTSKSASGFVANADSCRRHRLSALIGFPGRKKRQLMTSRVSLIHYTASGGLCTAWSPAPTEHPRPPQEDSVLRGHQPLHIL